MKIDDPDRSQSMLVLIIRTCITYVYTWFSFSAINYDKAGDIYQPCVLSKCHFDSFVKIHLSACLQLEKTVKGIDVILFIALKCCHARNVGAIL